MYTSDEEWGNDEHQPSRLRGALSFKSKDVGGYRLGKTLGKGSCAVVKLGIHRDTGKHAAVKILKPRSLREQKEALREVEALQRLNHPNITRMHQVIRENGYTCIILELSAGGELFDYVMNAGKLDEEEARFMFRQICSALQYCHANLVAHRDIKPENLLLDEYGNIKMSDFGLSNVLKPGRQFSTWCGSPVYTPPEVVLRQQYCGVAMDIWSLGVVLYVLVTGGMPWRLENNVVKNMEDLIVGNYDIPDFLGVSDSCRELISMMLVANSSKRATLEAVMNHPWTCEGFNSPPDVHLEPKPLVKRVNEAVFPQLASLGFDLTKARADLASIPTCPALTAYHNLLTKYNRAQKVKNCLPTDASLVNSPAEFLQTVTRTRSKTYDTPPPARRSPQAYRKEVSSGDFPASAPTTPRDCLTASNPLPISSMNTFNNNSSSKKEKGVIRSFFDKVKRMSSPGKHKSPTSVASAKELMMNYNNSKVNNKHAFTASLPIPPRPVSLVVEHNSPSPLVRRRM